MDMLLRLVAFATLFLALCGPAYAYLDPVTGSLIIQGLIAGIAAVVAGVKTVRVRIIHFFSGLFARKSDR